MVVHNLPSLERKFRLLEGGVMPATMVGLLAFARLVAEEARRLVIQGPKTGIVYRRRGRSHQASAPGEPPATMTGELAQSIEVDEDATSKSAYAVAGSPWAKWLEFGTRMMAARPFMRAALENVRRLASFVIGGPIRAFVRGVAQ